MDPMQVQNQQVMGTPQQQVPIQPVVQNIPQQPVAPTVQPVMQQPVVQQDSLFDKLLKGIVDFIAKLAAPAPTPTAVQQQPGVSQPAGQPMPGANFFNKIGTTLDSLGNQAEQMIQTGTNTVIQGTQNYVAQQPAAPIDTQQFLSQNYQPNTMPIQQQPNETIPQQPVQPTVPTINPTPNQQ